MSIALSGSEAPRWRIRIDTGGTFTDCLAVDPEGGTRRLKVLSSSSLRGRVVRRVAPDVLEVDEGWLPAETRTAAGGGGAPLLAGCRFRLLGREESEAAGVLGFDPATSRLRLDAPVAASAGDPFELLSEEEAPVLAARLLTGTPSHRPLPPVELRLATTRGTNALLERKGAPVALFVTRGFGDLLAIGDQSRPDLFDPAPVKPEPLYREAVEVTERLAADGSVLAALDLDDGDLDERARELVAEGVRSAAVALLHSYLDPTREGSHERALGRFLAGRGFTHVALSAELAPLIKIVPRAETAVVDAYLAPIVGDYVERVAGALPEEGATLHLMTSAGGLVRAGDYRAKDSLLSGPAGGVVGAAEAGRRSGFERVIAFDMGGTSTDVSRYDGAHEYLFEHRVGDARLLAPALAIETVAAGGGSICRFAGGRLLVGPESAGADPGPACYGAGGPLTLTDVNLLLGRLDPERFGIPVDPGAAERRLDQLMTAVGSVGAGDDDPEALLAGCLEIADERMADAVRRISVRRGYDPAGYALVAFGGAGGQHAASLAEHLGVDRVLVPRDAGLLSAVGLDTAVVERFAQRQVLAPLESLGGGLGPALAELADEAVAAVAAEGVPRDTIDVRRRIVELRLEGQETTLAVEVEGEAPEGRAEGSLAEDLAARFADAYRDLYGYPPPARPVEVESIRVAASSRRAEASGEVSASGGSPGSRPARPAGTRRAWFGDWREVPCFEREALAPGDRCDGPALVFERHASTVVPAGWDLRVDGAGGLVLTATLRSEDR